MYAVLKIGVFLQKVYFAKTLIRGKDLLVDMVNDDRDDYHEWCLVKVEDECEIDDCPVLYSLKKPINFEKVGDFTHYHRVKIGDLVLEESE